MKQTSEQTYKEVREDKDTWIDISAEYEEFIKEMKKACMERNKQNKELNNGKEKD